VRLQEKLAASVPLCGTLGAVFTLQWLIGIHNHKEIDASDSSVLQSQDSFHHNMACIICFSASIYMHAANLDADGTAA
jgi:hypothetical protein